MIGVGGVSEIDGVGGVCSIVGMTDWVTTFNDSPGRQVMELKGKSSNGLSSWLKQLVALGRENRGKVEYAGLVLCGGGDGVMVRWCGGAMGFVGCGVVNLDKILGGREVDILTYGSFRAQLELLEDCAKKLLLMLRHCSPQVLVEDVGGDLGLDDELLPFRHPFLHRGIVTPQAVELKVAADVGHVVCVHM